MGKALRVLKVLRRKIPSFKCLPGCTGCCGPTVFSGLEWERVHDKRRATSLTCPYAGENGCDIYKDRPILCRLFGTVERMKCPHGCGPQKLLTPKEEDEIRQEYGKLISEDSKLLAGEGGDDR